MKICLLSRIIFEHDGGGGMEIHTSILCRGLVKRGHSVTIITTRHPKEIEYEEKEGIKTYYLKNTIKGLYSNQWWKESARKFEELQDREKYNVILSQSSAAYNCVKRIKAKYNIPYVVISHGTWINQIQHRFNLISSVRNILSFYLRAIPQDIYRYLFWDFSFIRNSDAIIAVSKEVERALREEYFIKSKKIYTIYNGVDTSLFSPSKEKRRTIREKYGIKENYKILLLLGQIENKGKGMDVAIKAMPKILQYFPNTKLLIVGKGTYQEKLKTLAYKLDVLQNIIFCGYVPHKKIASYYSACDIFLNPTLLVEACPFVTLEALATGKPIIASRLGAIKSIINDGKTGFLIKPGDIKDLTKKTINLFKNKNLAKEISRKAREKALREFNQENMVKNTIKVLEKVIEEKDKI